MSTIICGDPPLAHQWVLLPAGERAGIERLVQYMTRCPFSLSRLVKISESGQVVYKAEKQACRARRMSLSSDNKRRPRRKPAQNPC